MSTHVLDEQQALYALAEARGNVRLAAERLGHELNTTITHGDFVRALKDSLPELKQHMEVVATLELFEMMPSLHKIFVENLTALEPADAVNAYLGVMKLIGTATQADKRGPLVNINMHELVWKQIGALGGHDLQEALLALEQGEQDTQNGHTSIDAEYQVVGG
jgi:hypothetical protein